MGTGVGLSVLAGVFTFGIGTVVGLGLTAAGATAAGVATGAGIAGSHENADHGLRITEHGSRFLDLNLIFKPHPFAEFAFR